MSEVNKVILETKDHTSVKLIFEAGAYGPAVIHFLGSESEFGWHMVVGVKTDHGASISAFHVGMELVPGKP